MRDRRSFRREVRGDVATLWLDTKGARVNIFSVAAADELMSHLGELAVSPVSAVVIRSEKPRSFVNGVGLMLANTVKSEQDADRLTLPVRAAYRALREFPKPTIAMVDGSCFGCGVELTLHCHHRVATDAVDTEFYMTEIADYLFVPVFGSTYELPRRVGLAHAVDLLLWGERWDAAKAFEGGLVDEVVPSDAIDPALDRFVASVVRAPAARVPKPERDVDAIVAEAAARIETLAPDHRPAYSECLALLERSARHLDDERTAGEAERLACGRSAMRPVSKAAQGFFFVREIADRLSRGRTASVPDALVIRGPEWLESRCPRGRSGRFELRVGASADPARALVIASEHDPDASVTLVDVRPAAPIAWRTPTLARVHLGARGRPFFEVASLDASAEPVHAALERAGLPSIRTTPSGRFVSDRLIDAFADPILARLRGGAAPTDVARSLRDLGFTAFPRRSMAEKAAELLPALAPVNGEGSTDPIASAVVLSLVGAALASLRERTIGHVACVDVMVTELLGFSVGRGGLCRFATVPRIADLLASGAAVLELVAPELIAHAEEYVRHGQPFYRS